MAFNFREKVYNVDPSLLPEIRKYGKFDIDACYACGSCVVQCPLTDSSPFPRNSIRIAQLGLKEALKSSLEPWLCYYCGECTTTCPRKAEAGEAMMTLRRYLTAQYEWTGLAAKFYKSPVWEIVAVLLVAIFVLFLFTKFIIPLPPLNGYVTFDTIAPAHKVHIFDLFLLSTLSFFVIINIFRMWWFTMVKNGYKFSPLLYLSAIPTGVINFFTQIKFSKCENKTRWIKHLLLFSGYVLMFTFIVVFLEWFQTGETPLYPQRWIGYYATIVLVYCSIEILKSRMQKKEQLHRYSELSDWLFPILLLLTAVTGIFIHIFRFLELPLIAYWTYIIHLMVAVPMLVVEVPFSKWAHLYYRPLAIYFNTIQQKLLLAREREMGIPKLEEVKA